MRATGRLSSVLSGIDGVIAVAAGPVSGWLAERAFGWTAVDGRRDPAGVRPRRGARCYREPRRARPNAAVWTVRATTARSRRRARGRCGRRPIVLFLVFLAPSFQTPLYFHQRDVLRFSPGFIGTCGRWGAPACCSARPLYGVACRYLRLRTSLVLGIGPQRRRHPALPSLRLGAVGDGRRLQLRGASARMSLVPVYDLATRATPKGSESFGFGLMMSVRNVAIFALSNYVGAVLYEHHGFRPLVWINALATAGRAAVRPLPAARSPGRPRAGTASPRRRPDGRQVGRITSCRRTASPTEAAAGRDLARRRSRRPAADGSPASCRRAR